MTMSIRERLRAFESDQGEAAAVAPARTSSTGRGYQELKRRVHQTLLDRVDLGRLQKLEQ
jgi:hypothetical protein